MKHIKLAKKVRETNPKEWQKFYEDCIVEKIRQRYTVNQELAILRQRDSKPEEYAEYDAFVERCKAEVRAELEV